MFLFFKRCLYDSDFWPFSLGDLNIILGTFRFFIKLPRKLGSAFPLKLRFLEIRLLVTWLKWQLEIFSPSLLGTVLKDQNHHTPQIYYPSSTSSLVTAVFLTLITLKNTVFFFWPGIITSDVFPVFWSPLLGLGRGPGVSSLFWVLSLT